MIFLATLPGASFANVAFKWLVNGVWGNPLTVGITDTGGFDLFVINSEPPAGAQEIMAYDVTDESNRSRGNYLARSESGGASVDDIAARIIADHGAGSYASISGGSGAYLVTVTVTDVNDDPLENAIVRLSEGSNVFTAKSNASGVAAFNLDTAAYAIGVTKAGYQFTPSSIVVTAPANFDAELTLIVLPIPTDPAQSIGYLTTYDAIGNPEPNVILTFAPISGPGAAGHSYLDQHQSATSDAGAFLSATFARGSKWRGRRGKGKWVTFTVPDSDNFALPEILGHP
jgi:hypothetical protein